MFSVVATIVGVAMVVNPMEVTADKSATLPAVLAALIAAFGWAASGVLSRDLFRKIHFLVLTTWVAAFAFASIAVVGIATPAEKFTVPQDWTTVCLLAALAIIGILVMYTFNASFMVSDISL